MSRSSAAQFSQRVNQAFQFLEQNCPPSEIVTRFATQLGISPRQAARYLQAARRQTQPQAIPEPKVVFTVKLPAGLAQKVRQAAQVQRRSLSDWVAQGLEAKLRHTPRHG